MFKSSGKDYFFHIKQEKMKVKKFNGNNMKKGSH